jgi:hypothetical protein
VPAGRCLPSCWRHMSWCQLHYECPPWVRGMNSNSQHRAPACAGQGHHVTTASSICHMPGVPSATALCHRSDLLPSCRAVRGDAPDCIAFNGLNAQSTRGCTLNGVLQRRATTAGVLAHRTVLWIGRPRPRKQDCLNFIIIGNVTSCQVGSPEPVEASLLLLHAQAGRPSTPQKHDCFNC